MKTKNVIWTMLIVLLGCSFLVPDSVQAKKKKEKKKYEWKWDGELSGNETVDQYLLSCDTLWTKIQNYREQIDQFDYKEDTLRFINGADTTIYLAVHLENKEGQLFSKGVANWQLAQSIMSGVSIVLESTQIGLQTASATLALPQLGLGAISFAKYVKAGPNIIAIGMKEIKEIVQQRKYQWGQWKQAKEGAIEDLSTIDWSSLEQAGAAKISIDNLNKCFFIKKIEPQSETWTQMQTVLMNKTQEEMDADNKNFAMTTNMPEDTTKKNTEFSDDEFQKMMQENLG